jgi:formylglycine-generating enzyme required for sulfatase activity
MTRAEFVAALAGTAWAFARPPFAPAAVGPGFNHGDDVTQNMILVPGGKAILGSSREEVDELAARYGFHPSWLATEQPRREVDLAPFYLDKYPVTNIEYLAFCQSEGQSWPLSDKVRTWAKKIGRLPVASVNFDDAAAYAEWIGKRLPTEEEWEYAARGPRGLLYPWGNEWDPSRCNTNEENRPGGRGLAPIHAYPQGAGPFGICDMIGNLCEWTTTEHGTSRVVKGGFWKQHEPYRFRAACRLMTQWGTNRQDYIGFRCAKDAPQ